MPRKEKKCETCAYAQGLVKTLIDPCPKCVGKTSIFPYVPAIKYVERGRDTAPEKGKGIRANF